MTKVDPMFDDMVKDISQKMGIFKTNFTKIIGTSMPRIIGFENVTKPRSKKKFIRIRFEQEFER